MRQEKETKNDPRPGRAVRRGHACQPFQPREEGGIFPQPNQPRKKENSVSSLPSVVCPGSITKKIHQKEKTNCLGSRPSVRGGGALLRLLLSTQNTRKPPVSPPASICCKMQIATIPPRVPAVVRPRKDTGSRFQGCAVPKSQEKSTLACSRPMTKGSKEKDYKHLQPEGGYADVSSVAPSPMQKKRRDASGSGG